MSVSNQEFPTLRILGIGMTQMDFYLIHNYCIFGSTYGRSAIIPDFDLQVGYAGYFRWTLNEIL
jgi:hypothetical protein